MSIPDIYWEEKAKLTGRLALEHIEKGEGEEAAKNLLRMTYALSRLGLKEESGE